MQIATVKLLTIDGQQLADDLVREMVPFMVGYQGCTAIFYSLDPRLLELAEQYSTL